MSLATTITNHTPPAPAGCCLNPTTTCRVESETAQSHVPRGSSTPSTPGTTGPPANPSPPTGSARSTATSTASSLTGCANNRPACSPTPSTCGRPNPASESIPRRGDPIHRKSAPSGLARSDAIPPSTTTSASSSDGGTRHVRRRSSVCSARKGCALGRNCAAEKALESSRPRSEEPSPTPPRALPSLHCPTRPSRYRAGTAW